MAMLARLWVTVLASFGCLAFAVESPSPLFTGVSPYAWNVNLGYGIGTLGNSTDTVSRTMSVIPLEIFVGYRNEKFRIGPLVGAGLLGQLEEPSSANNQNLGGTQIFAAIEAQYFFNVRWGLSFQYKLFNELELETKTASGYTFKYTQGSGKGLKLIRNFRNISVFATYSDDQFTNGMVGGNSASLTSTLKGTAFGVGIILGNFVPQRVSSGPGYKYYEQIPTPDIF